MNEYIPCKYCFCSQPHRIKGCAFGDCFGCPVLKEYSHIARTL